MKLENEENEERKKEKEKIKIIKQYSHIKFGLE
jgi:hypothetical protein